MKRRILGLLVVLALLMVLPFAVTAESAEGKRVTVDMTSGTDLTYSDMVTFFVKGPEGEAVPDGTVVILGEGNRSFECTVQSGVAEIPASQLVASNLLSIGIQATIKYHYAPNNGSDYMSTSGNASPITVKKAVLTKVELTGYTGYEYGKPLSGFQIQNVSDGATVQKTVFSNRNGTELSDTDTFGEAKYRVGIKLGCSNDNYELSNNVEVTLNGVPPESTASTADGVYHYFWLSELVRNFTVKFSTGYGTVPVEQTVQRGGYATRPADLKDENDNYAFKGWYTDEAFQNAFDFSTPINDDVMLYAKWVKKYTVSYKPGGHGQSTMPNDEKVVDGETATKPVNDPKENGWKFQGWYDNDDYLGRPFDFSTPIKEDTNLYAKWVETRTVAFNLGGHGAAVATQTVDYRSKAVKPENPKETGWRFDGWYTDEACTAAYDFEKEVTENITLYAKWVRTVTVTYHVGSYGTAPASQTVDAGEKFTCPAAPTDSRAIFQGWYTDANYTAAYDFNSAMETDLDLYAKWKDGYRVVFQTAHGTAPAEQKVAPNGKATKPTDPTAAGYVFKGWYTNQLYTTEFDFNTPITADTTLYAKWTETYTVTFNVGGHGAAPAAQTVEKDGKATKPENPTAKGWRFDGWYTDEKCTKLYNFNTAVTADMTLYAKWTQLFTLTFETNGGTKIDSVEAPDGSLVYLGSYKPTKSGYYFVGWYTDKNLTRESRVSYVRMDGNKTVYAKFAVADKTNPKTADPAMPGLALAVLSFSTVGLAAMGLKKRK